MKDIDSLLNIIVRLAHKVASPWWRRLEQDLQLANWALSEPHQDIAEAEDGEEIVFRQFIFRFDPLGRLEFDKALVKFGPLLKEHMRKRHLIAYIWLGGALELIKSRLARL